MKNKNRLTVEEVNEFKPSFYNPLEVECDDGWFTRGLKKIKIITPIVNNYFTFIDSLGSFSILNISGLEHYPSQKPEREKFYIWRYCIVGNSKGITAKYYNKEFKDTQGHPYAILKSSSFKEICTEFRPIYSDGRYADE